MIESKKFTLNTIIILCALFLTACTPPQPTENNQLDIFEDQAASNQQLSPEELAQTESVLNNQPQGITMKSLSDFAPIEATQATLNTTKGPITFELYREQAPLTTLNFLTLAQEGFYDGIVFHRVIEDFMAQVGDPLTKNPDQQAMWGSGGPGYKIEDEFSDELRHDSAGVVSMANSGPNTGGSQFFITYEATPWLDGKHAIFGKVTSGMEVLEQIEIGDKIESIDLK